MTANNLIGRLVLGSLVTLLSPAIAQKQAGVTGIPHLDVHGDAHRLMVDGRPFLMLAGELGNSSASDTATLEPIWQNLTAMHLNTVLVPVSWELLEPREGDFDFTLVEYAISAARRRGLRIVLLWFGTWKNSMSCYAPLWVKTDQKRFPRARTADGTPQEIVTPFSEEGMRSDARAFGALMRHVGLVDGADHTVLMVQVENEIGMIPEARDHCTLADGAFHAGVPFELLAYLRDHRDALTPEMRAQWGRGGFKARGTWEEVFGVGAPGEEAFMAWYLARYTNTVAAAGKREYLLPMYVNAALIHPGFKPGQYPSGGPLPHLFDIWKAAAPKIDFFAPDIYLRNFAEWIDRFDRSGNTVFVPEAGRTQSIANAFYALGKHNAIGYSPFSIESTAGAMHDQIARGYEVLTQLQSLILEHQGTGTMTGVLLDSVHQTEQITFGPYRFTVKHEYTWPYAARAGQDTPRVGGLIMMLSPDEFLLAGGGIVVTFSAAAASEGRVGIGSITEGRFADGRWIAGRRLNGDEDHQGRHLYLPGGTFGIQRLRLYPYK